MKRFVKELHSELISAIYKKACEDESNAKKKYIDAVSLLDDTLNMYQRGYATAIDAAENMIQTYRDVC